jgi:hypothetical protein
MGTQTARIFFLYKTNCIRNEVGDGEVKYVRYRRSPPRIKLVYRESRRWIEWGAPMYS